ncbi:MAG TPA: hypothetical protein VGJ84_08910, partial [Polyangiaceae bacterium]
MNTHRSLLQSIGFSALCSLGITTSLLLSGCSGADTKDQNPATGAGGQTPSAGSGGQLTTGGSAGTGTGGASGGQAGTGGFVHPPSPPRVVTLDGWTGSNRDRLNQLVTEIGISSASYSPDRRPVAVFDWDNTTVKNDIGDATFAWLVKNDKILQPPALDWSATNTNLTPEARAALNAACDASASPGQPLPTSTTAACAAELMNVYYNAKTTGGLAAWNNEITSTSNQPYGWVAQLLAGYTPDEVRGFAQAAFLENVNAAVGTKQTVGGVELAGYIRIYEQIRELINVLQDNGFDVWVVT